MDKPRTRVEIVDPPWVKDPSKWPFGHIILPLEMESPKRILLDADTLALQLRCPRDLIREFFRIGYLHEATEGEERAELGLCAEDLAAIGLGVILCTKYNMPLRLAVAAGIQELRNELLHAPRPLRVILGLFDANRNYEMHIGTCSGPLAVWDQPGDAAKHQDFYDASDLRDRTDAAMDSMPLKLPAPETCLVKRPVNL